MTPEEIKNKVAKRVSDWLEKKETRKKIIPPIEGEITEEKLEARGITIRANNPYLNNYSIGLYQNGKEIDELIITKYSLGL